MKNILRIIYFRGWTINFILCLFSSLIRKDTHSGEIHEKKKDLRNQKKRHLNRLKDENHLFRMQKMKSAYFFNFSWFIASVEGDEF